MWSAKMALSQNIGVPWIMCQQYDAPDPVVRNLIPLNFSLFFKNSTVQSNFVFFHPSYKEGIFSD